PLLEHRSGTGRARKRLRGQRISLTGAFGRLREQPRPATGGRQPPVHEPFAVLHDRLRLVGQAREGKSVVATLLEQPREDDFLPAPLPEQPREDDFLPAPLPEQPFHWTLPARRLL